MSDKFFYLSSEALTLVVVNSPKDSKQSMRNVQVLYKNQKALPPDEPIFTNSSRWTAKKVRKLWPWIYWKISVTYICKISLKSLHFPWTWLTCPPVLTRKSQHWEVLWWNWSALLPTYSCSQSTWHIQVPHIVLSLLPLPGIAGKQGNSNFLQLLLPGCHSKRQIQ